MTVTFYANEISGLADPTYNSGGANKKYVDAQAGAAVFNVYPEDLIVSKDGNDIYFSGQGGSYVYSGTNTVIVSSSTAGGQWSTRAGGIYYDGGEVSIGYSAFDVGAYQFQISGDSYFSGAVSFIGELSGLADPTYNSGATSKHYVDSTFAPSTASHGLYAPSTASHGLYYPSGLGETHQYLSGLTDTGFANPISGAALRFDGTNWLPISSARAHLFATKPAAATHKGEMIRVSGGAGDPTYLYVSAKNSADSYIWMQLGVTS